PCVITFDDRLTPLVKTSGHRLPRIQLRLNHVTIVAPTPDNRGSYLRLLKKHLGDAATQSEK
ncbi:MAG: hypothetical protein LC797_24010, partial [Chloroflexi bacterium]|nr:hypothetical protein [Chloroflexota bacterium]